MKAFSSLIFTVQKPEPVYAYALFTMSISTGTNAVGTQPKQSLQFHCSVD
jgi:hypothetical protein